MEGVVHLKIASGIYLQIEHGVWAPVWVYCLATCLSSLLVNISECGVAFLMHELVASVSEFYKQGVECFLQKSWGKKYEIQKKNNNTLEWVGLDDVGMEDN